MARKRRDLTRAPAEPSRERSAQQPTESPPTPVRSRWRIWLAFGLVAAVLTGAWWGSALMVRRAQGSRIPPLGDLSGLPEPVRAQIALADAVARANPESADALGALGMAWHASLRPERALEAYGRAASLAPAAWKWTYYRGLLFEERGQQAEAREAFSRVTQTNPVYGLAWFRLGEIAFKQGRLVDAEQAYVRAGRAPPTSPFTPPEVDTRHTIPLTAYAQLGVARVALDRGLEPQAASTLDGLIAQYPSFGPARALRSQLGANQGRTRPDDAAGVEAYIPPADPLLDEVVAQSRMRDLLLKHAAVAGRGDDRAWREFLVRRALEFNPRDPNVLMEMASMLQASGRCTDALDYLRQREQLIPDDHVTLVEQGRCLSEVGRLEEAERVLRRAARIRDAAAEYNLGVVLDRQGKGDEARQHYERALDIDPFHARAMVNLGVWYDRRGQSGPAVSLLQRAVRAAPDNADAYSNLGSILIGARRLPEALEALETAVSIDPDSPEAHNNMGIALAQSGRLSEAAQQFETALRLNPNHLNARRNLDRLRAMVK